MLFKPLRNITVKAEKSWRGQEYDCHGDSKILTSSHIFQTLPHLSLLEGETVSFKCSFNLSNFSFKSSAMRIFSSCGLPTAHPLVLSSRTTPSNSSRWQYRQLAFSSLITSNVLMYQCNATESSSLISCSSRNNFHMMECTYVPRRPCYFLIALRQDWDLPVNEAVAVESVLSAQPIVEVNPSSLRSNRRLVPSALHTRQETTVETTITMMISLGNFPVK